MTNPIVLDEPANEDRDDDIAERVDRARRLREAAEREIRERTAKRERDPHWITEKAWRSV